MEQFRKILCPVDFSDYSELILRYGLAFAQKHAAKLVLLSVIPEIRNILGLPEIIPPGYEHLKERAIKRADQLVSQVIPRSIESECRVVIGPPVKTILAEAENQNADLIITATHGLSGYERFVLGSVTYKLIHKSKLPVLVVRKPTRTVMDEKAPIEIKSVLCAMDFGRRSQELFDSAWSVSQIHEAELFLMHVTSSGEQVSLLKDQLDGYAGSTGKVKTVVEVGSVAERIVHAIDAFGIDLALIGHHTHLPIEEWILGSVALRVVTDASCPVLILRA